MKTLLRRLLHILAATEEYSLLLAGFSLVVVVAMGVLFRYVIRAQLIWAYELSILLFIWVSFLGASVGMRQHAHVTFDFLTRVFPMNWNRWINLLGSILIFGISIAGVRLGLIIFLRTVGQRFQTLPISRGWMYLALPVGFFLIAIHVLEYTIRLWRDPKELILEPTHELESEV